MSHQLELEKLLCNAAPEQSMDEQSLLLLGLLSSYPSLSPRNWGLSHSRDDPKLPGTKRPCCLTRGGTILVRGWTKEFVASRQCPQHSS